MVDQAQIKPTNGRSELPPRAVARSTAEFLSDVATLAELQGKLVIVDLRDGISKLVVSVVLVSIGTAIALGSVPIALAALALTLQATTTISLSASFGIALLVGLVLAAALAIPAAITIKKGAWMFDRSQYEWRRNTLWAKDAMKKLGKSSSASVSMPGRL